MKYLPFTLLWLVVGFFLLPEAWRLPAVAILLAFLVVLLLAIFIMMMQIREVEDTSEPPSGPR